ncbi:PREDICTED: serine/threonine-protein kinase Nek1-like isoform X1 [Branchiostoma belcheri]|uniref:non-specific serine/threonine protein kinase n=1 Tax=Branchiostoma belcheri TaxID=7741 RepID=A0A6P4YHW7_BRABE|nr:PREDICTED: serine/threonine-protein kinase Nek1-like isoform X1 [Branchiostoma belcheri]
MEKYQKVKRIGEGSFGKALLVRNKKDGKQYVIKEISITKMSPKERQEARREVTVLSKMKHTNIVSYQESFEEVGNLYIVMDFCDGGDLYQRINAQRGILFPEDQVMNWFVQLCLALKHVHDRKILHRDIKSQNIFLMRDGTIKLGDFGIARVLNNTMELARTCIGTPYYLSPEMCENRPYNNKSDIWALGCVLYEMCTLKHAFEAGNMKNLVLKIIRGSYPPVSPRYTYELRNLVAQLFKRNPRDRPSINSILRKNFISKRIEKFLSQAEFQEEFSHTVLHKQHPLAAKPPVRPAVKPVVAGPRISDPAAKYGVPLGGKKQQAGARKSGDNVRRLSAAEERQRELERKRKELVEREARRRQKVKEQEERVRQHQQKLSEKRRMEQINQAREQGWRFTLLGSNENKPSEENKDNQDDKKKKPSAAAAGGPVLKKPLGPKPLRDRGNYEEYHAYLDKLEKQQKESQFEPKVAPAVKPYEGWPDKNAVRRELERGAALAQDRARQGEVDKLLGAQAADRGRVVEEFLQRKRQAAMNKARGQSEWARPVSAGVGRADQPGEGQKRPWSAVEGRNQQEQEYLARLRQIRLQNFNERRALAGGAPAATPVSAVPDPRFDVDARRKKIEALRAQADQRAQQLKEQLEKKRRDAAEKERRSRAQPKDRPENRAVPYNVPPKIPEAFKGPVVGLTAALENVGAGDVKESPAEENVSPLKKEKEKILKRLNLNPPDGSDENGGDRRKWGAGPAKPVSPLVGMTLEQTASHMEATSAEDKVLVFNKAGGAERKKWGQPDPAAVAKDDNRKRWGGPANTALRVLQEAELNEDTMALLEGYQGELEEQESKEEKKGIKFTIPLGKGEDKPDGSAPSKSPLVGTHVVKPKTPAGKATITIQEPEKAASPIGKTITIKQAGTTDDDGVEVVSTEEGTKTEGPKPEDSPPKTKGAWAGGDETDSKDKSEALPTPADDGKTRHSPRPKSASPRPTSPMVKPDTSPRPKSASPKSAVSSPTQEDKPTPTPGEEEVKTPTKDDKEGTAPRAKSVSPRVVTPTQDTKPLFTKVQPKEQQEQKPQEEDDLQLEEVSFYATAKGAGILEGLSTGCFDSPNVKMLRTCSMPDLSSLFKTDLALNPFFDEMHAHASVRASLGLGDVGTPLGEDHRLSMDDADDEAEGEEKPEGEEKELSDEGEDLTDYYKMKESMENLLEDSTSGEEGGDEAEDTADNMDEKDVDTTETDAAVGAEGGEEDDDSAEPLNEDWQSARGSPGDTWCTADEEDIEEDEEKTFLTLLRQALEESKDSESDERDSLSDDDDDSVFSRLEETRMRLEDELGPDVFIKAYKAIQAFHEDEDENMDDGPKVVGQILGKEKEYLYPKILQLVMADGAYCEDND